MSGSLITRVALCASLGLWWANVALTSRWAHVPGAVHGPKLPWVIAALAMFSLAAVWTMRRASDVEPVPADDARLIAVAGAGLLVTAFVTWFPLSTWAQIPFLDDWAPRWQSTREAIDGLRRGLASGWQWSFLGGYHISSDVTQSLGLISWLPMTLLGDRIGFHVVHLALFAAIPWLLWREMRLADDGPAAVALVTIGIGCVLAASYSYLLMRSGDTNSLAGAVMVLSALHGAHAARRARAWGGPWLVVSLVLVAWSHAGSFVYAIVFLIVDALLARDLRSAARAAVSVVVAQMAALPMTWESWRYPELFHFNNIWFTPPSSIDWPALFRKVAYNVELLWLPGRWANDYGALALVLLPVSLGLAVVDRSRVRFYAVAVVVTVGLMRLNDPHFGYAFIRPIHMFPLLLAPVIAGWLVCYLRRRLVIVAGCLAVAVYVQIWWQPVQHVTSMRDVFPVLVDRVTAAPGALVLVENNPHRNTNAEPDGETVPSLTGNHYEALLAHETGRRLYAGYWDGWQWSPWRGQMLSGGTWMGRDIRHVSPDEFVAELDRWGVVDLLVWSDRSREYLQQDRRFVQVWSDGPWTQFRRPGADGREVVVVQGDATLTGRTVAGATVELTGQRRDDVVVVRTNFHPAWTARVNGTPVSLESRDGQLSFMSPCDGDCVVTLEYPRRPIVWSVAILALVLGLVAARYDFGMVQK